MKRRMVLATAGAAFSTSFIGCLSSATGKDNDNNNSEIGTVDPDQMTHVNGLLIDEAPDTVPITEADDSQIADNDVIQTVLERAADPDVEKPRGKRASGTYEVVSVDQDDFDKEDLYEAAVQLEQLPRYDESAAIAPTGWYVQHPDQLVVMGYGGIDK